jgi:hypothetical protein
MAQAIPVYSMLVFLIPKGVCKKMVDAISKFWWSEDENSNKITLLLGGNFVIRRERGEWGSVISAPST